MISTDRAKGKGIGMSRTDDIYKPALQQAKLPILTLDNNWHKLFTQADGGPEIRKLEHKLNNLLKKQGKVNTEQKKVKALKRKLMDEIMELADQYDASGDEAALKKLDEHKRLVEECNGKIEEIQDDAKDLPREIQSVNYELMLKTMEVCYDRLKKNREEIEYYEDWIKNVRVELKKNIIRKQEKEADTYELYSYMHNIFGPDVIDIFDMHYDPEEYRLKKKGDTIS